MTDTKTSVLPKMNPEIKEKWVAALRSGDYKQGTGRLCTTRKDGPTEYCCLGVLSELAAEEGAINKAYEPGFVSYYDDFPGGTRATHYGHKSVYEWADFPAYENGNHELWDVDTATHVESFVANHNDGYYTDDNGEVRVQWTFAQIADWIEENL